MLYVLLIISIILIYSISKSYKTNYGIWLTLCYIGFLISMAGLILYSVYYWDYYYLRNIFFEINPKTWLILNKLRISSYNVNRILNIGLAVFHYSALGYGLCYHGEYTIKIKHYILFSIPAIVLILFYDPFLGNELFIFCNNLNRNYNFSIDFYNILTVAKVISKLWFYLYLLVPIISMIFIYKKMQNKFIRHRALGINISISTLLVLHIVIFYWAPEHLVQLRGNLHSSVYNYSFESYKALELNTNIATYFLYPTAALFSLACLIYAFYKYNIMEFTYIKRKKDFSKNIHFKQATSSVTHMVKNSLIEIKHVTNSVTYSNNQKKEIINEVCNNLTLRLDVLNNKCKSIKLSFDDFLVSEMFGNLLSHFNNNQNISLLHPIELHKIYGDKDHLLEVFINIIKNSFEVIDEKKIKITIEYYQHQKWNCFIIEDNGPGIDNKNLKKIFQPFYTTKNTKNNWGIGLAYCQKIIEGHRGKIFVESKKNEGLKTIILIPITPQFKV